MIKRGFGKKGVELATLYWWLVAVIVLVIVCAGISIMAFKDKSAIEYIIDIIRFKR
jgi:hypothetical protein